MNITAEFRTVAATHAANTDRPRKALDHVPDTFVREAYKLYGQVLQVQDYLEKTRKAYLSDSTSKISHSTAIRKLKHAEGKDGQVLHLTESQRDEIDYEVKKSIREASNRVKELESLEAKRRQIAQPSINRFFGSTREKARNDLLSTHHASVTWYLNHLLLKISQRHAETKTIRLRREEERKLAVHSTSRSTPRYAYEESSDLAKTSAIETDMAVRETLLSASQLQQFESENTQILEEFDSQVSQIKSVQGALLEIAELSNELQSHLQSQTEMTDRLMTEAEQTTMDVSKGNEQLDAAKRRNKNTRLVFVTIFLTLAFTLLFLDYYSS